MLQPLHPIFRWRLRYGQVVYSHQRVGVWSWTRAAVYRLLWYRMERTALYAHEHRDNQCYFEVEGCNTSRWLWISSCRGVQWVAVLVPRLAEWLNDLTRVSNICKRTVLQTKANDIPNVHIGGETDLVERYFTNPLFDAAEESKMWFTSSLLGEWDCRESWEGCWEEEGVLKI